MSKQGTANNPADDVRKAANDAGKSARDSISKTTDRAVDAGNEVADRAVAGMKEVGVMAAGFTANAQKSLGGNIEELTQRLQGLGAFSQQNLAALTKSSEVTARAFESIGAAVAAYSKKSYEDHVAAAQELAAAKSPAELIEKQASFAHDAFENWAQQAVRMSAIFTSAAKEIAAPLGERALAAREEMKANVR
jgi:phasin family protein